METPVSSAQSSTLEVRVATTRQSNHEILPNFSDARALFQPHLPCAGVQLRKVYLRLALKYHPDKWPDSDRQSATALFQAIAAVYDELSGRGSRSLARRVKSPVSAAAELGDLEELDRLLKDAPAKASEDDENGVYPVMFAAKGGSTAAIELLVHYGADLSVRTPLDWSVLLFAALSEQERMVRWLVANGVHVTSHEVTLAAYTGSAKALGSLVEFFDGNVAALRTEEGGNAGDAGRTLLHLVCDGMCSLKRDRPEGYVACVELLLRTGVPVDVADRKRKRTCLQSFIGDGEWREQGFEASPDHMKVLKLLCDHGASPSAEDKRGDSALSLAKSHGLLHVGRLLSEYVDHDRQHGYRSCL